MKNWVCHRNLLSGSSTQYLLFIGAATLTFDDALHLLETDSDFRNYLTELLTTSEYVSYRWETPSVTTNNIDRQFEFVLNGYSSLKIRPAWRLTSPAIIICWGAIGSTAATCKRLPQRTLSAMILLLR